MIHPHRSGRGRKSTRRGTIYIIVLGTALIASLMGMSALMIQRIQRNAGQQAAHVVEARMYADAALRIGMLRIENDPDWRYSFANGDWEADVIVGDGTYTLQGIDPSDGNLSDSPTDPLVLKGIGTRGNTIQKTQVTLATANRALSCLEVGMHSAGNMIFNGAVLNFNGTISSNDTVIETGSSSIGVNTDVEAVNAVVGDDYGGTPTTGIDPRDMPDSATAFDYYKNNGTWINVNAIVLPTPINLLTNPGFESGITNWEGSGCDLTPTGGARTGAQCILHEYRSSNQSEGFQDVTPILQNGQAYYVEAWAKTAAATETLKIDLYVDSTGSGTQDFMTDSVVVGTTWTKISGVVTPTWTGTLAYATWRIFSWPDGGTANFYTDDAVMSEMPPPPRTIYRAVLSPTSNPYGPGTTNSQGIYVIDCQGQDVHVQSSRIFGTLVLLNPAAGSSIRNDAVNWAPAVPSFPALMVDGDFEINANNNGLNETAEGTNFNPVGTPHPDLAPVEDSDLDDTYPSEINGLIFVSGNLAFSNHPVVDGVAVANTMTVGDAVDLTYQPLHLSNPPPGFSNPEEIKIVLDSAQKVVD